MWRPLGNQVSKTRFIRNPLQNKYNVLSAHLLIREEREREREEKKKKPETKMWVVVSRRSRSEWVGFKSAWVASARRGLCVVVGHGWPSVVVGTRG